ncbi:MAG: hypothetical protein PQJ59_13775 [Spirochaetales bacterium]|nr:hypothetical protein [Spirochaetales bacterium]
MKKYFLYFILICIIPVSLFSQSFDFMEFYYKPFIDKSITIPPVFTDSLEAIEHNIFQLYSKQDGIVKNIFFRTENVGIIYKSSKYTVEYVQGSGGTYYRERIVFDAEELNLKYDISIGMDVGYLREILKDEDISENEYIISTSYEDIHIFFYFANNKIDKIEFLRGD